MSVDVRKGMPPVKLTRDEFEKRYRSRFIDPAFAPLQKELDAIIAAAWDAYSNSRKSPLTRKAGEGFADPDYEIAIDWLKAHDAIKAAQTRHDNPNANHASLSSTRPRAVNTPARVKCQKVGAWPNMQHLA